MTWRLLLHYCQNSSFGNTYILRVRHNRFKSWANGKMVTVAPSISISSLRTDVKTPFFLFSLRRDKNVSFLPFLQIPKLTVKYLCGGKHIWCPDSPRHIKAEIQEIHQCIHDTCIVNLSWYKGRLPWPRPMKSITSKSCHLLNSNKNTSVILTRLCGGQFIADDDWLVH